MISIDPSQLSAKSIVTITDISPADSTRLEIKLASLALGNRLLPQLDDHAGDLAG